MSQNLERWLDINNLSIGLVEFAKRLGSLKLNTLLFIFVKFRLNKGQTDSGCLLVNGSVVKKCPLKVSNKLTLYNWGIQFLLSQSKQELQTGHVITFLHFKQKKKSLVLNISVSGVKQFVLELAD
jgi:hypothetical protein